MQALRLVRPSVRYQASFVEAVEELIVDQQAYLLNNSQSLAEVVSDFAAYVGQLLERETSATPPFVRNTVLWAVVEERFVGRITFRHELNDRLSQVGGHIGFAVRPSERGKGCASEMLRQALDSPLARRVGDILITCDEDNAASDRIIRKQGGVFAGYYEGEGPTRIMHFRFRPAR